MLPSQLAVLAGLLVGVLATAGLALLEPGLYIDWASFAAVLVVVPVVTIGAGLAAGLTLVLTRRMGWSGLGLLVLVALIAGEITYAMSLRTPFARWSAARHWAAVELEAGRQRLAADREVCRRLPAEPPPPPPPAPPGARAHTSAPPAIAPVEGQLALGGYTRERCERLLRSEQ